MSARAIVNICCSPLHAASGDARPLPRGLLRGDTDVLEHRELGKDQPPLRNIRNPGPGDAMRRPTANIGAVEQDVPAAWWGEAHDRAVRRRLSDPVAGIPILTTTPQDPPLGLVSCWFARWWEGPNDPGEHFCNSQQSNG